ncbi:peroxiredoxin (alkyl hydroperoxide reductase subunit C) [Sphingomonas sp. JUb134]|nr:peroxiredoxin (alkyl hydroperoxide reductase subunit C) [Sphingomonas sp. JUb134]MEA3387784.1 peroxiredoxin [Pseudomonadota bacterium]
MTNEVLTSGPSRSLRMGDTAPDFEARTTRGMVRLSSYRGRWIVFFSHPADFTPVCTTEFVGLAKAQDRFEAMDCALLGLSVDSLYAHAAWAKAIRDQFDVEIGFPIVEDPSMAIARAYGMLDEAAQDSSAVRAAYFIDPEGVIQAITHYPMSVGRSVDEMVRMVAALQAAASGDRLTPEGWRPGEPMLLPPSSDAEGDDWFCRAAP